MDFTNVSRLGKFSDLCVQTFSLLLSLSKISFHDTCLIVDSAIGAPRYLEGNFPLENRKIMRMFLLVIMGVLKKYTWDLSLLISNPLASRKVVKPHFIPRASKINAYPNNIVSSTNCWCFWGRRPSHKVSHWIRLLFLMAVIILPSPSAIMMKRNGERGSSCRIPLEDPKGWADDPLTRIEKNAEDTKFSTHSTHCWWNPNARDISAKKHQFKLSYALKRSNFSSIPEDFVDFKQWMFSCTRMIPSKIWRPSTKLAYSSEIILGRTGLSLLVMTLVIILYMTLHRAIVRNLLGSAAPISFGMRVRNVALNACRAPRAFREASTISRTSSLIQLQHKWKKFVVKLSGTGALSSAIWFMASSSSISVIVCRSNLFWSSEIMGSIFWRIFVVAWVEEYLILLRAPGSIPLEYFPSRFASSYNPHPPFSNGRYNYGACVG